MPPSFVARVPTEEDVPFLVVACIFLVVGPAAAVVGVRAIGAARRLRRQGVQVQGRVVGIRGGRSRADSSTVWSPVVEFTTPEGEHVTASPSVSAFQHPPPVGTPATVWYDPAKPTRIVTDVGRSSTVAPGVLLAGLGTAVVLVGLVLGRAAGLGDWITSLVG